MQISTWKCTSIQKKMKAFLRLVADWLTEKPFYSQHVVGMLKECLWSKNKQIIVSLKAVWFYSRQRIICESREMCASTYKSFWTWIEKNVLTYCRAIAKRAAVMTCLSVLCKSKFFSFFFWRRKVRVGKNLGCFPERKQRRILFSSSGMINFRSLTLWLARGKWLMKFPDRKIPSNLMFNSLSRRL